MMFDRATNSEVVPLYHYQRCVTAAADFTADFTATSDDRCRSATRDKDPSGHVDSQIRTSSTSTSTFQLSAPSITLCLSLRLDMVSKILFHEIKHTRTDSDSPPRLLPCVALCVSLMSSKQALQRVFAS